MAMFGRQKRFCRDCEERGLREETRCSVYGEPEMSKAWRDQIKRRKRK